MFIQKGGTLRSLGHRQLLSKEDDEVLRRKWRNFLRHLPGALAGNTGCAMIFGGAAWFETGDTFVLLWIGAVVAISALRLAILKRFARAAVRRHAHARGRWIFLAGKLVGGGAWGLGYALILPSTGPQIATLGIGIGAGLMAGSATTSHAILIAHRLFVASLGLPLATTLIMQGTTFGVGMALGGFLFAGVLDYIAYDRNRQLTELFISQQRNAKLIRQLEAARDRAIAADSAKTSFLNHMSHELRTPLNAIIGFSDILAHETFGPLGHDRYREYARDIQYAGEHLRGVVNNLLDLSKIDAGRMDVDREPVAVSDVLNPVTRMAEQRLSDKTVAFEIELCDPEPVVYADHVHTHQILINLLTNAAKASPDGGTVRVTASWISGRMVEILIEDNGPGMDADTLAKALEPFRQIRTQHSYVREGGTGLGLPLAKRLVEINNGRIDFDSVRGNGTSVRVRLPAAWFADT